MFMPKTPEEMFLRNVDKTDTCWLWSGDLNGGGYGRITRGSGGERVRIAAHRYSYELFIGPIPEGLIVMHKCDVRRCVNPDHLALGTIADNNRDKWEKGRHACGGTPLTIEELAELREAFDALSSRFYGMTPTALARAASKGRYVERVTRVPSRPENG